MPRDFNRSERVAGSLRRELAKLIQFEVDDPDVGFVGLSDVEVTRDLAHARVFVTVFEPEKAEASLKALNRAAGFLRRRLAQEVRMRSVPELHFQHDASVETGHRMDSLIDAAIESDGNDSGGSDPEAEP
ncbi:MAG: 30S ribosome-binding factor RbfA [Xanthomonadales bacterium]|jgi:ribosome-binding factor A|nr:30S ribosome-binding factor RbfA [Gammaproteobacteria bacterium]MBT8064001.1 30S ribosome-binding factor RbfA [Gammaproteobacteria bacterium]NNJ64198.1 30S ribosome-binding factor RbfA [Xanthomonadales bacterium]NNK33761.1 30S ribosome-binding factor RbfA [Xanthomonadales bacterium]NNK37130.1 30S ribosome-binding factor RbfA [Xanthomonadales bacterium]